MGLIGTKRDNPPAYYSAKSTSRVLLRFLLAVFVFYLAFILLPYYVAIAVPYCASFNRCRER